MINKIKTKILDQFLSYNPQEFLPIYHCGKLANRREFALYKAKIGARLLLRSADRLLPVSR